MLARMALLVSDLTGGGAHYPMTGMLSPNSAGIPPEISTSDTSGISTRQLYLRMPSTFVIVLIFTENSPPLLLPTQTIQLKN